MATHALKLPLFLTRLSVFYFMGVWALDRIIAPGHAANVAKKFYKFGPLDISTLPQPVIGGLLLLLYVAFLLGFKKQITYGLVLLVQFFGLITIIPNLIPGLESYKLIFVAAWPAFMATILLYCLRDEDTMLALDNRG